MMTAADNEVTGYADAAPLYWEAGWRGILPIRRGCKKTPPTGYTGKAGIFPSYPDILAWADLYPDGNLCLRLPDGVIGVDIDGYGAKTGAETIIEAELRWGALPDTIRSTSRDDRISGIRLYRAPPETAFSENIEFPELGIGDVEIIQRKHRYVLCWPSTHPEGRPYRWIDPDDTTTSVPHPDQLPELPKKWIDNLKAQPDTDTLNGEHFHTPNALTAGNPSETVAARLREAVKELNMPGQSRHITCRGHVLALLRLGTKSEAGTKDALILLGETFVALVAADRAGGAAEARREFWGMVFGRGAARHLIRPGITDWVNNISIDPPPNSDDDSNGAEPTEPHPIWGYHPPVDGVQFLFRQPDTVEAWWGEGEDILWASGEALMIAGGMGLGKTTLAGQIMRAQLCGGGVLGLPVAPVEGNILYLAMDRPRQIARSLRRQFDITHEDRLRRLYVRPGPPPRDLAADPSLLCRMADAVDASVVYIDSLKDAAVPLSKDEIGAAYNRGRQFTLNHDRQICELHHNRKTTKDSSPGSINEVYGSVWLTAGCGSIINLIGEPGDPIIEFRHIKQPLNEVGPFRLLNNTDSGMIEIEHEIDLLVLADAAGGDGLTAKGAAAALFAREEPTRAQEAKARRRLDKLTAAGLLTCVKGRAGGDHLAVSAWFRAAADTGWADG